MLMATETHSSYHISLI